MVESGEPSGFFAERRGAHQGRRLRARRGRGVARARERSDHGDPAATLAVAPPAANARLRRTSSTFAAPSRSSSPSSSSGPERRAPRARLVHAHRPPHGGAREVEQEIDYCLFCHERDKDSCSQGACATRRPVGSYKKNPLGVPLSGCPLDEKISEMHVMRQRRATRSPRWRSCRRQPDVPRHRPPHLQRLHEGVRLPEAGAGQHPADRDARAHRGAALPWGMEIYGLLTRWNPLNVSARTRALQRQERPRRRARARRLHARPPPRVRRVRRRRGRRPEDRAARPAARRGATGAPPSPSATSTALRRARRAHPPRLRRRQRVRDHRSLGQELPHASSTSRSRGNPHVRIYGGVRFGGTITLEDAWALGFDHVAIAAGAGRPTHHRHEEQPVARHPQGERLPDGPAAHGRLQESSIANLQVSLPGRRHRRRAHGDRHGDRAARVLRRADREDARALRGALDETKSTRDVRAMFDDEEWELLAGAPRARARAR